MTILNQLAESIHFDVTQTKCIRYIAPTSLELKKNKFSEVHWVTSKIDCLRRFSVVKLAVKRKDMLNSYLMLDAKLYGSAQIEVISSGIKVKCNSPQYNEVDKLYAFQCVLGNKPSKLKESTQFVDEIKTIPAT
ncbi:hypothetical protein BGC07_14960 [Piscirickettsia litoralis]|uniref:Uncharacterized protein n=2 Tax=Piscirickettsia litoralis TaxID=1891921 RepID=A0ABX3A506_9GAMM|nr:hypothetical protein BGC07_14960 [Piscirickettsia litoralis]